MQNNNTTPIIGTLVLPETFTVKGTQDKKEMSVAIDKAWLLKRLTESPLLFHSLLHTLNASFVSRGVSDLFLPFYTDEDIEPTEEQIEDFLLMRCGPPGMKLEANQKDLELATKLHNGLCAAILAGRAAAGINKIQVQHNIPAHERSTVEGLARYLAAKRKWIEWKVAQESQPTEEAGPDEDFLSDLDQFES